MVDMHAAHMAQGDGALTGSPSSGEALRLFLLARAYLYLLFHKLFGGYPNDRLLDMVLGQAVQGALAALAAQGGADSTLTAFGRYLGGLAGRDRTWLLRALTNEYAQMFIGPMALPAFPYESPYLTDEATLFQENTERVRVIYRSQGLLPKGYLHVPDDHIALMCDFMARLARASYGAVEEGDARLQARLLGTQEGFVRDHLGSWIPAYATSCRIMRNALLYPQAIEAFAAFVRLDGDFLPVAARRCGFPPPTSGDSGLRELKRAYHDLGMLKLEHIDGYELDRVST